MNCVYCKKEIAEGSAFCNWCGKKQIRDFHRKANGISLAELSLRSGVSYDMLKRYGRQYMPSAEALVSIARELGTTAEELLK